jgi:hypothetical protein
MSTKQVKTLQAKRVHPTTGAIQLVWAIETVRTSVAAPNLTRVLNRQHYSQTIAALVSAT